MVCPDCLQSTELEHSLPTTTAADSLATAIPRRNMQLRNFQTPTWMMMSPKISPLYSLHSGSLRVTPLAPKAVLVTLCAYTRLSYSQRSGGGTVHRTRYETIIVKRLDITYSTVGRKFFPSR